MASSFMKKALAKVRNVLGRRAAEPRTPRTKEEEGEGEEKVGSREGANYFPFFLGVGSFFFSFLYFIFSSN